MACKQLEAFLMNNLFLQHPFGVGLHPSFQKVGRGDGDPPTMCQSACPETVAYFTARQEDSRRNLSLYALRRKIDCIKQFYTLIYPVSEKVNIFGGEIRSNYLSILAFSWAYSPCFSGDTFFSPHPLVPSVYQASFLRCKTK